MKANPDIRNILFLARSLAAHRNWALSTVSLYSAKSGKLYREYEEKLRNGQPAQILNTRRDRILQWFSDNWPCDLEWPDHVDRPTPAARTKQVKKGDAA